MVRFIFVAIMVLFTASCATAPSQLQMTEPGPYRLGPGDEVRITVFGLNDLNNTYRVSDSGSVSIPLIGQIAAEDKTTVELEVAIVSAILARELIQNPRANAQVEKYRPFFIVGEVQRPGQYPYVPGMTALKAVSVAGGYTFRAEKNFVGVSREVEDHIVTGRAAPESLILPDDTIHVYEAWF